MRRYRLTYDPFNSTRLRYIRGHRTTPDGTHHITWAQLYIPRIGRITYYRKGATK